MDVELERNVADALNAVEVEIQVLQLFEKLQVLNVRSDIQVAHPDGFHFDELGGVSASRKAFFVVLLEFVSEGVELLFLGVFFGKFSEVKLLVVIKAFPELFILDRPFLLVVVAVIITQLIDGLLVLGDSILPHGNQLFVNESCKADPKLFRNSRRLI